MNRCPNDTNGDGDCRICAKTGICHNRPTDENTVPLVVEIREIVHTAIQDGTIDDTTDCGPWEAVGQAIDRWLARRETEKVSTAFARLKAEHDNLKELDTWRSKDWPINVYTCEQDRNHLMTTVDVDKGTTPFMASCRHPGCGGLMRSACYPRERPIPRWVPPITHEWYAPKEGEYDPINREHVEKGGLLLRERTDREPIPNPYGMPGQKPDPKPTDPGDDAIMP